MPTNQLRVCRRSGRVETKLSKVVCWLLTLISTLATPFLSANLFSEFPRFTTEHFVMSRSYSVGLVVPLAVRIRLKFRKCEVNWRVRWMVHIALRAIVFVCRGALEFGCDALEFENLPIGDSETLLHFVPISRLRAFAIDAKCVELYAFASKHLCSEQSTDRGVWCLLEPHA